MSKNIKLRRDEWGDEAIMDMTFTNKWGVQGVDKFYYVRTPNVIQINKYYLTEEEAAKAWNTTN